MTDIVIVSSNELRDQGWEVHLEARNRDDIEVNLQSPGLSMLWSPLSKVFLIVSFSGKSGTLLNKRCGALINM